MPTAAACRVAAEWAGWTCEAQRDRLHHSSWARACGMGAAIYAALARAGAFLFLGLSSSEASAAEPSIEAGQRAPRMRSTSRAPFAAAIASRSRADTSHA